jgi:hypothetical protein
MSESSLTDVVESYTVTGNNGHTLDTLYDYSYLSAFVFRPTSSTDVRQAC